MRYVVLSVLVALCTFWSADKVYSDNFPSAHEAAPAWWPKSQPTFALSADYPKTAPASEAYPWKSIDFRKAGFDYLRAVLAYVYEGNIPSSGPATWDVQNNKVRKWYHAPWMEVGKNGREFIHGLTRERTSLVGELWNSPPNPEAQNWAVGFYNPPGGYVVGQVWSDPNAPDPKKALNFPDGTVAAKLLFTMADAHSVPYLKGSFEWLANAHSSIECRIREIDDSSPLCERSVQTVRLLQIDVAVRDDRPDYPSPTNWVFGTFVYDGNAPGKTPWERMVPVGIMWGNDPGKSPENVAAGYQLQETVINHASPVQHAGCAWRLNGPVDNPLSSCLSCHAGATFPVPNPMVPKTCDSSPESLAFFQNINSASPRDPGTAWFDYSLQLSTGFRNFCLAYPKYGGCGLQELLPAGADPSGIDMEIALPAPSRGN